tara:strand:- start:1177 stop:1338 length:162 start_codon:yes stop_codon:yes gene_type:complete
MKENHILDGKNLFPTLKTKKKLLSRMQRGPDEYPHILLVPPSQVKILSQEKSD